MGDIRTYLVFILHVLVVAGDFIDFNIITITYIRERKEFVINIGVYYSEYKLNYA